MNSLVKSAVLLLSCLLITDAQEIVAKSVDVGKPVRFEHNYNSKIPTAIFFNGTDDGDIKVQTPALEGAPPTPGYSATSSNVNTGLCVLDIASAKTSDNGVWTLTGGVATVNFNLTVFAKPQEPYILYDGKKVEDDKFQLLPTTNDSIEVTCVSEGASPRVSSIKWFVDGEEVKPQPERKDETFANKTTTSNSTLILPTKNRVAYSRNSLPNPDKETTFKCVVSYNSTEQEIEKSFGGKYETTKVMLEKDGSSIFGNKKVNLVCKADGIPLPTNYAIQRKDGDVWKTVASAQTHSTATAGTFRCTSRQTDYQTKTSPEIEITSDATGEDENSTTVANNKDDNGSTMLQVTTWVILATGLFTTFHF